MHRYLNEVHFKRFIMDFGFLFRLIRQSHGELDLRLRDNYFSLYYRGNSMMKVDFRRSDYKISIHRKFVSGVFDRVDSRLEAIVDESHETANNVAYSVPPSLLYLFLQRAHLAKLGTRIKSVNQGEENTFEHALITDNLNRQDYMIIDRQVTEPGLGYRMDLLGLRQHHDSSYTFEVIEVKMGNNRDLASRVGDQLNTYLNHVHSKIGEWAASYEITYEQLRQTDIFKEPQYQRIRIEPRVAGRVVVMGYSGIAKVFIDELQENHPNIRIQQMSHLLK